MFWELYLTNNFLPSLNGIGEYKALQRLELNNNQILSIPIEIMKLSSTLTKLSIDNNKLDRFPYEMTNVRALNSLSAVQNQIPTNERNYLTKLFRSTSMTFSF
jgi:Leucine-rich repeat (LRR) protein